MSAHEVGGADLDKPELREEGERSIESYLFPLMKQLFKLFHLCMVALERWQENLPPFRKEQTDMLAVQITNVFSLNLRFKQAHKGVMIPPPFFCPFAL